MEIDEAWKDDCVGNRMLLLTWIALGLGGIGLVFMAIGLFAPHAVHLF